MFTHLLTDNQSDVEMKDTKIEEQASEFYQMHHFI